MMLRAGDPGRRSQARFAVGWLVGGPLASAHGRLKSVCQALSRSGIYNSGVAETILGGNFIIFELLVL